MYRISRGPKPNGQDLPRPQKISGDQLFRYMDEDDDVVMVMRGGGVQLEEEQRVSVCSSTLTEIILYRLRKLTYVLLMARAP